MWYYWYTNIKWWSNYIFIIWYLYINDITFCVSLSTVSISNSIVKMFDIWWYWLIFTFFKCWIQNSIFISCYLHISSPNMQNMVWTDKIHCDDICKSNIKYHHNELCNNNSLRWQKQTIILSMFYLCTIITIMLMTNVHK